MSSRLHFFQNLLALSATTLIITVWATVTFLVYQNKLLEKYSTDHFAKNKDAPSTDSQLGNWKTYKNVEFGIFFQYPITLKLNEYTEKDKSRLILYSNPSCIRVDYFTPKSLPKLSDPDAIIWNYLNHKNLHIGELTSLTFPKSKLNTNDFTLKVNYKRLDDVSIAGLKWFQLEVKNNYENHGTLPEYFLERDSNLWSISSGFGAGCTTKEIDQILSTFKFINDTESLTPSPTRSLICPSNGWVDCMPILSEEKQKLCTQDAINWYKENCPNYQGIAY